MSWSIATVIKVVVRGTQMGERHADGWRWRRQRAASDTLTSQHGARRPASPRERLPPLLPSPSRPFPLLLYSICSSCLLSPHLLHFLPTELRPPPPPLSSAAARSLFILLEQTDGSWLLWRRKFGHVLLIKAPHRSPADVQRCLKRAFRHGDGGTEERGSHP